jgi:chorismate lyase/3-hydroxybenzoate synthase
MPSISLTPTALAPRYTRSPNGGANAVAFGASHPEATITIPIPQLGPEPLVEEWTASDEVRFGSIHVPEDGSLEPVTNRAYEQLIAETRAAGYPHLIRVWNHVPQINDDDRGRERYQRFCEGRYQAFQTAGYGLSSDLPAASAVGMRGDGLAIYYIASRTPAVQVENPRQLAAYRYPPQYGPKSPSFSRATRLGNTVFLSGTASIVGHETLHRGDVDAQLQETLRNLDAILNAAFGAGIETLAAVKTYVRHEADYDCIAAALAAALPPSCTRIFLHADICRADLLLEIEGVGVRAQR